MLLLFVPLLHCQKYISKPTPKLTNGVLDLREWDIRKEKVFEITGDYIFYPNFLLIKNDLDPSIEPIEGCFFDSGDSKGDFECNGYFIPQISLDLLENKIKGYSVDIPHRWKDKQYGNQILTAKGVGLYKLQFQVQEPTKLSFTSEPDFSLISYRLWLKSGKRISLIQKSGHPTPTPKGMRSHSIPVFVTEVISDGDELLLEIANWENRVGGLKSGIFVGNPREVSNFRDIAIWSSLVIFGLNTMAGLYHFFLFILRPSNRYTLWFGVFCVVIGMRVLVISKPIQIYFPDMNAFSFLLKLEYLTMTGSMAIFIVYIKEVLENKIFYPWYYVVMFISICSSLVIVSTDTFTFTNLLTYFQLGLLVGLLWIAFEVIKHSFFKIPNNARNKYISRSITYVSIIFISSIVHDLLMYQGFLRSVELTAYGLVLFLLGQGVVIARVNAKAWSNSEHLSKNLQKEVELRTIDYKEQKEIAEKAFVNLKESQDKLILAEKQATLNQIITNISHELNTPLGAIQATSESLRNSILNLQSLLKNYIENMGTLQYPIDLESIFKILNHISINSNSNILTTRDHRRLQKELKEELKLFTSKNQLNEINSIENLSVLILEAGLQNIYKEYSNILKSQNAGILEFFIEYNGLLLKANLFKSSSEKMFKTVTMIRSLLPDREEIVRDNLDLVSIIKESIEIYSNKIQAGIHLHLDFQEYPIVAGTSLEYKQVFANIILNAIQAVENSVDKNIYIKTFLQDNKIVVEVEDSGVGISEENQSKIFQPMFTTRQHAEGSGLGLYISQRNLNKYGYKLNFESNPGKTKFWIDI